LIKKIKYLIFFTVVITGFNSCVKKKNYQKNPVLEYKSFTPLLGDTAANLVIGFTDGNGDIGKEQEDKTNNLFMTYYYFDATSNKFVAIYDPFIKDTTRIPYTIRKPSDDYNGKSISGEIAVRINQYRPSKTQKRIKYVMYLIDNAGNKSNILSTPELIVP
jgi:hypothetical protein